MDHGATHFNEYLGVLLRRKGLVLSTVVALMAASGALAFGLPAVYRSTATIMVEQPEIPQELVRSTVASYSDHRINTISQRVMTSENLSSLIRKHDLYPEEQPTTPIGAAIEQMRADITMKTVSAEVVDLSLRRQITATVAFTVSYDNASPKLAMVVANDLAALYLGENIKSREQTVARTAEFLAGETDKLRSRLLKMEAEIAAFKESNADTLPELARINVEIMNRTEQELNEVDNKLRSLQERAIFLSADLGQMSSTVVVKRKVDGQSLSPHEELEMLQTRYLSISAIYAADHPDVVQLRKKTEAVRAKVLALDESQKQQTELAALSGELAAARSKYSDTHPDVKRLKRAVATLQKASADSQVDSKSGSVPIAKIETAISKANNPAYVKLRAQLNATQLEIQTQEARQKRLKAKLAIIEDRMLRAPQVEREYRALNRDYEHAQKKYDDIVNKQTAAQLAQVLESEQQGERFTLIEPAPLPVRPSKPNRMGILSLGMVFSLVVGFAVALLAEILDGRVRGTKDIAAVWDQEPLAVIPYIDNSGDVWRRVTTRAAIFLVVIGGAVGLAAFVNEKIMPLDDLMLAVMNRFGI